MPTLSPTAATAELTPDSFMAELQRQQAATAELTPDSFMAELQRQQPPPSGVPDAAVRMRNVAIPSGLRPPSTPVERVRALGRDSVANTSDIAAATGPMLPVELGGLSNAPPTPQQVNHFSRALDQSPVALSSAFPEPGLARGAAQAIEGVTTPKNALITAAAMVTGGLSAPIAKVVSAGLSIYFAGQMATGLSQRAKHAIDAWHNGDLDTALSDIGGGSIEAAFLALGLTHTVGQARELAAAYRAARPKALTPEVMPPDARPQPLAALPGHTIDVTPENPTAQPTGSPYFPERPAPPNVEPVPNRHASRPKQSPLMPETGVPSEVSRAQDARENLAQDLTGRGFAALSNPERLAVDDLVSQGYQGQARPRPFPGAPADAEAPPPDEAPAATTPAPVPAPQPATAPAAALQPIRLDMEPVSADAERDRVAQLLSGKAFGDLKAREQKAVSDLVRESARENLAQSLTQKPFADLSPREQKVVDSLVKEGYAGERAKAPAPEPAPAPKELTPDSFMAELQQAEPDHPTAAGLPAEIAPYFRETSADYAGRPEQALQWVREKAGRFAHQAIAHPEFKNGIGLLHGEPGDPRSDWRGGFGVAHIDAKRPGYLDEALRILPTLPVVETQRDQGGRLLGRVLSDGRHRAVVSMDLRGNSTPEWLLTSYERPASATSSSVREAVKNGGPGPTPPETGALQTSVTENPDTAPSPAIVERPIESLGPRSVESGSDDLGRRGKRGVSEPHAPSARQEPGRESVRQAPGDQTTVYIPGEQHKVEGRYEVRDLSDIQPSHHGESFGHNSRYEHQNERDYSKAENQQRIIRQSSEEHFNPRYLITDNPDATNGPPVIDQRGNVLGGNSRAMTMQRVYARNAKAAAAYREHLAQKAPQFGIDPSALDAFKNPVLVRVASPESIDALPGGVKWIIRKTNVAGTALLSGSEQAIADAGQITPAIRSEIARVLEDAGEGATLSEALTGPRGARLVNSLIEQRFFAEGERPKLMVEKTGAVTQLARDRITKALLGGFFDRPDEMAATPPSLLQKLERAAVPLATVGHDAAWDLSPDIRDAVALIEYARAHGLRDIGEAVKDHENDMFHASPWSARAIELAQFLSANGQVAVGKAFRAYAAEYVDPEIGRNQFSLAGMDRPEPATPQEAYTLAFINKGTGDADQIHFAGSGLGALFGRLFEKKDSDEPLRDYSALGALKNRFVRNLSQLEQASPEAHPEVVRAAASRAQAVALMRSAWPFVEHALGGRLSGREFKNALVESRLRGLRDRWNQLADLAQTMPDAKLAQFAERGPLQVLANMGDNSGFGQDLAQIAAAHIDSGDFAALRDFMSDTFREAGDRVAVHMTPGDFTRVISNAVFPHALDVYKTRIADVLAKNHAANDGIFSDALGPLDTYFPLMALSAEDAATIGKNTPFKRPANPFNDFATGLAPFYDTRNEALLNRVARAFKANDKASALAALQDAGLLQPLEEGERAPSEMEFGGKKYKAETVEISPLRQRIKAGEFQVIPSRAAVVPSWLREELAPIFESPLPAQPGAIRRVLDAINSFAITGIADPIIHTTNLLGALVANTPFLGEGFAAKTIGNTPLTKLFTAITKVAATDPMDARAVSDLHDMARLGLLPERFASETYSEKFAEQTGAKLEKFSLSPVLYGPNGIDVRARLVMYRVAKAINPDAAPGEIYKFVNQLGNYTRALQGTVERAMKGTGFSPFYTAGSTMVRNGVDAWTGAGAGSGPGASGINRLAQQLSGGAVGVIGAWVVTYKATTGRWPWEDRRALLLKIPVPDSVRGSSLGRALWGPDTRKAGYVNFSFFSPLVSRGARALGINGAVNTLRQGGSAAQIAQAVKRDVLNTNGQPIMGPAARATLLAATGKQAYFVADRDSGGSKLMSGIDKHAPIGSEVWQAAKQINALAGNVGAATGFGSEPGEAAGRAWYANILEMVGMISRPTDTSIARRALATERARHR